MVLPKNDSGKSAFELFPASTVREYFQLLEDTLLGFSLPPWARSQKRKPVSTAKFYLFDTGVRHTLAGTKQLERNSDLYKRSFEVFRCIRASPQG